MRIPFAYEEQQRHKLEIYSFDNFAGNKGWFIFAKGLDFVCCQTSTSGAGPLIQLLRVGHALNVHSCTLRNQTVNRSTSNPKRQTLPLWSCGRPSISCRRFIMATTGNSSAGPNCGFICLFYRYAYISKEFNYTRRGREFKHMHVPCGGSLKIKSRATKCTMSRVCVCWWTGWNLQNQFLVLIYGGAFVGIHREQCIDQYGKY